MFSSIKAIVTNKDIRKRILFTLFAFLVYRLGSAITVPDVNTADLINGMQDNSLFAMLNLLGGGGLEQFSVFALGVTPYITASIILQLLSMDIVPSLTELSKSGAQGRKKIDQYTRYLAVVFAFVQSFSLVYGFSKTYTTLIVVYFNNLYRWFFIPSLDWRSNLFERYRKWYFHGYYGRYRRSYASSNY